MRITKFGHACVRLEKDGRRIVIDPGGMTPEADGMEDVEAVLVTHEHFDHFSAERLHGAASENPDLVVYTCPGVARHLTDLGDRVRILGTGNTVSAAGFEVTVAGDKHHINHPDVPPVDNIGFVIDGTVFHPGDALTVVDVPILLVPGQAPWMATPDLIGYLRRMRPRQAFAIHDGLLNAWGMRVLDSLLAGEAANLGADVRRLGVGESVDV